MTTDATTSTNKPTWLRLKETGLAYFVRAWTERAEPEIVAVQVERASAKQVKIAEYGPGMVRVFGVRGDTGEVVCSDLGWNTPALFASAREAVDAYAAKMSRAIETARNTINTCEAALAWAQRTATEVK